MILAVRVQWPSIGYQENTHSIILGAIVGTHVDLADIWRKLRMKIESRLLFWKKRNLSFKGKVLVIKSLGLSQLNYVSFSTAWINLV